MRGVPRGGAINSVVIRFWTDVTYSVAFASNRRRTDAVVLSRFRTKRNKVLILIRERCFVENFLVLRPNPCGYLVWPRFVWKGRIQSSGRADHALHHRDPVPLRSCLCVPMSEMSVSNPLASEPLAITCRWVCPLC